MLERKVLNFLQKEIDAGHIPGATIHVSYQNEVVMQGAIGNRVVHPSPLPMELNTVFDLASLTKVIATLPAILRLLEEGEIRLDDAIVSYFPAFAQHGKENVRIYHLLTHTSGLPPHKPFFEEGLSTEEVIQRICNEQLVAPLGEKVIYSDLGLITLYLIIEKITGQPFAEFVKKEIYDPLDMIDTGFNPSFERSRYAATEFSEKLNDYKQGIVHDENTESMGGVSGHAGLFSTVSDLA
ncbi:MAG: serine hydrolase domain-containing protein, partial [Bacilli bacterium]